MKSGGNKTLTRQTHAHQNLWGAPYALSCDFQPCPMKFSSARTQPTILRFHPEAGISSTTMSGTLHLLCCSFYNQMRQFWDEGEHLRSAILIGCGQGHSIGFREILSNSFIKPFLELQLATYPYQHLQTPCNSSSQLPKARDELKRCKVLLAAELCKFIYKKWRNPRGSKRHNKQETCTTDLLNRVTMGLFFQKFKAYIVHPQCCNIHRLIWLPNTHTHGSSRIWRQL